MKSVLPGMKKVLKYCGKIQHVIVLQRSEGKKLRRMAEVKSCPMDQFYGFAVDKSETGIYNEFENKFYGGLCMLSVDVMERIAK